MSVADAQRILAGSIVTSTIDFICGVPDSSLQPITDALSRSTTVRYYPREDVAVAAAVGAELAGRRPMVFMKNAGLGTALDAIVSLAIASGSSLILLIGGAGMLSSDLLHHTVWGQRTQSTLKAMRIPTITIGRQTRRPPSFYAAFLDECFQFRQIRAAVLEAS